MARYRGPPLRRRRLAQTMAAPRPELSRPPRSQPSASKPVNARPERPAGAAVGAIVVVEVPEPLDAWATGIVVVGRTVVVVVVVVGATVVVVVVGATVVVVGGAVVVVVVVVGGTVVERRSRWRGQGSWATLRVETSSDGAVVAVSPG